jgi:hypothetical protein
LTVHRKRQKFRNMGMACFDYNHIISLWGHIKWVVYETEIDNRNEFWDKIQNGSNEIRNNLEIFDSVRSSLRRRARVRLQANGRRFEHLGPVS